jgi:hypothetical protein
MRLFAIILVAIVVLPFAAEAQGQVAPPGYHYEPGSSKLTPNDPCWLPAMTSPGAVSNVNRSIGKPDGISARIVSISDLASADPNSLSSVGIRLVGIGNNGIACHGTLHFANGSAQNGVLSLYDPGEYAPLQIQWIPDSKIANDLARVDRLRTAKNLAVVPDLTSPSIQSCVGRALALGAGEQYPGQLWAACAQKNGSNLIPPTRASVNNSLDRCVDKMGASPEYAWAMAHPEAKIPGDSLAYAKMGLMQVFVWTGSPGAGDQRLAFHGGIGPAVPILASPDQKSEDVFQTEAVTLAGAYRELYAQMLNNGSSEAQATASAVSEVKADARIWCAHIDAQHVLFPSNRPSVKAPERDLITLARPHRT